MIQTMFQKNVKLGNERVKPKKSFKFTNVSNYTYEIRIYFIYI